MAKQKGQTTGGYIEKLRILRAAGISTSRDIPVEQELKSADSQEDINESMKRIIGIVNNANNKTGVMIFLVMYDIENNKVRTYISKYLEDKGCMRIQKSIFMGQGDQGLFNELSGTLREVQEVYENNDSIMLIPVATDQLRAMKLIGKNVDLDVFQGKRNTLFF